jgi:hypothetical protein
MSARAAHQALTPGRAVLLRQQGSGLTELALFVGAPGGSRSAGGLLRAHVRPARPHPTLPVWTRGSKSACRRQPASQTDSKTARQQA